MTTLPGSRRNLLSVEDAAQYLGVSAGTLRNWTSAKRIAYVKIGRLTRFSVVALDRYIDQHTIEAVAE